MRPDGERRLAPGYRAHLGKLRARRAFQHESNWCMKKATRFTLSRFGLVPRSRTTTVCLFIEAFADVPSWSVYEPAWQQKYLGTSSSQSASLRNLYSGVMLDVAWALFEIRMLHNPAADPNAVWTDITSRYLHIVPHPEYSWWAVRVQLMDSPGYMVNYGLGAVITAEIRQRIRQSLGPFDDRRSTLVFLDIGAPAAGRRRG